MAQLKVRKFWGLNYTLVEVPGGKLVGGGGGTPFILNRVKVIYNNRTWSISFDFKRHVIIIVTLTLQNVFHLSLKDFKHLKIFKK